MKAARSGISGALLAGGKGSRIGGKDKQELVYSGETLGRRIALRLYNLVDELIVVGSNPRPYEGLSVRFAGDLLAGHGPLSGLHAALVSASEPWVYLVACDMPHFSAAWFDYLASEARERGSAIDFIAARNGPHFEPFHALYSASLAPRLADTLGRLAGRGEPASFARALSGFRGLLIPEEKVRSFSSDLALFSSVNTFAEYETLLLESAAIGPQSL